MNTRSWSTSDSHEITLRSVAAGPIQTPRWCRAENSQLDLARPILGPLNLELRAAQGGSCEELRKIAFALGLAMPLLGRHHDHGVLTSAGDGLRTICERAVDHLAQLRLRPGHRPRPNIVALIVCSSHSGHIGQCIVNCTTEPLSTLVSSEAGDFAAGMRCGLNAFPANRSFRLLSSVRFPGRGRVALSP